MQDREQKLMFISREDDVLSVTEAVQHLDKVIAALRNGYRVSVTLTAFQ